MPTIKVQDIMNVVTPSATVINEEDSIFEAAKKLIEDPRTHTVYVINQDKKLTGLITVGSILKYLYAEHIPLEHMEFDITPFEREKLKAKDIMLPPVFVKINEPIENAFEKMFEYKIWELPVVDDEMHVVGDINGLELIYGYLNKNQEN